MRKKKIRSLRLNKYEALVIILLIPFFKLLSFDMFKERNFFPIFFSILDYVYDGGRIIAATYGYILLIKKKTRKFNRLTIALVLLFLVQIPACIINRSIDLALILKVYTYIGFVFILQYSFEKNFYIVLSAIKKLFGMLAIIGAITIILFPLGFLRGSRVYDAVYFLGGKNASFLFYLIFLLCYYTQYNIFSNNYGLPKFWLVPIIIMILASVECGSLGALLGLAFILIMSILYVTRKPVVGGRVSTIVLFVLLVAFYIGIRIPFIIRLLGMFGRDATFSNRTLIWKQAEDYIISSPLWGAGYKIVFSLGIIKTDHAHSTFLDMFAKYGIIILLPLYLVIRRTYDALSKVRYKPLYSYLGSFLIVYLFHIGFNDYNYNFIILMVMILNYSSINLNRKERMKYEPKEV